MRLKSGLFLVFTSMLLMVFSSSLISFAVSNSALTKQQVEPVLVFWITFGSVDWETRSVSTDIEVWSKAFPYNITSFEIEVQNSFYFLEDSKYTHRIDGGYAKFLLIQKGHEKAVFIYEGSVSVSFRRFGLLEFYPYDVHMVNITFSLPNFGLISQSNTAVFVRFLGGPEPEWKGPFSSVVWDGELARLNFRYSFGRTVSEAWSFLGVIIVCYLLLGSTPLIDPEKLEHRLTICLTLFIFAISFFGTVSPPVKTARLSLGEVLVYALLMATGLFAAVSIVEKALIEVKPRLKVTQYVLDIVIILATRVVLGGNFGWFSDRLVTYSWQTDPTLTAILFGILLIPVSYGYVSKTFVFAVRSLWRMWKNRAAISKRIKSTRLFHRKAKSS